MPNSGNGDHESSSDLRHTESFVNCVPVVRDNACVGTILTFIVNIYSCFHEVIENAISLAENVFHKQCIRKGVYGGQCRLNCIINQ